MAKSSRNELMGDIRGQHCASSSYDALASEYYDATLHPTSANFRQASISAAKKLGLANSRCIKLLDVGAGKSICPNLGIKYEKLVLTDASVRMLAYSMSLKSDQVWMLVCDALRLPFIEATFDLVMISLGDPFNLPPLWSEVGRVMTRGGVCIFTTPSYEWARRFRSESEGEKSNRALFLTRQLERLYVPSFIVEEEEQIKMIETYGLHAGGVEHVRLAGLRQPISPKLLMDGGDTVVTGYRVVKR